MEDDFFQGLDEVKKRIRPRSGEVGEASRWRVLYEISNLLNFPAYNFGEILELILDETIEYTGADRGFLMLYDDRDELQVRLARNMSGDQDQQISRSVVEQVLDTGEGVCIANIEDDEKFSELSSIIQLKILSVMCVPLKVTVHHRRTDDDLRQITPLSTRKILGVIYVDSQSITTSFSQEDLELFQALANNATTAIMNAKLYRQATTDELTPALTRRHLEQRLEDELKLARRSQSPLTLLLLDIDDLQAINRSDGYQVGDGILQAIGRLLLESVRHLDSVGRYGGDEFAVVLPQTDQEGGEEVARKIQQAIRTHDFETGEDNEVTVSIGVAALPLEDPDVDAPALIKRTDQALYEAKRHPDEPFWSWSPKLLETGKRTDKLAGIFSGDSARDYRHVLMLLEAIPEINRTMELDRLLPLVVDTIVDLTQAERGILTLYDDDGKLHNPVARDAEKRDIEARDYSRSVVDKVLKTGNPVCIEDTLDVEAEPSVSMTKLEIRAVMVVPLRASDRLLGAIYVDSRSERRRFDESSLAYFDAIARQAAVAIENAQLHEENQEKSRKIEKLSVKLEEKLNQREKELERMSFQDMGDLKKRKKQLALRYNYENIVGESKPMQRIFKMLDKITDSNVPVFIHGESGTGKELVAKAIHFNGPRRDERIIAENCAAMSESLLEAELFGHVKGSFTGATADKKGLFEVADRGTLFLDEIGDMTLSMQKKLLRVLEEGEVRRVGGKDTISVDVRIISASNKDLKKLVANGDFREDLYYRLNVVRVDLPPLSDRKTDIPLLVKRFLEDDDSGCEIARDALEMLNRYHWPGNVRELRNVVERGKILAQGNVITKDSIILDSDFESMAPSEDDSNELPFPARYDTSGARDILREMEKEQIYFEINDRQRKLLEYLKTYGSIKNRDYYEIMDISKSTGWRDIKELINKGVLICHGRGKGSVYTLKSEEP